MKFIVEIWNSVDFKTKLEEKVYTHPRKVGLEHAFCCTKEGKQGGLHRGNDEYGDYFGWPNTGYDCPAYRVRKAEEHE